MSDQLKAVLVTYHSFVLSVFYWLFRNFPDPLPAWRQLLQDSLFVVLVIGVVTIWMRKNLGKWISLAFNSTLVTFQIYRFFLIGSHGLFRNFGISLFLERSLLLLFLATPLMLLFKLNVSRVR
jgi:hypothetical protein